MSEVRSSLLGFDSIARSPCDPLDDQERTLSAAATRGPSGGAPATPPSPPRRLDPLAVIWTVVVLAVGAALGGGAYWFEQSRAVWRPAAERTADGWRIATPPHLDATAVAVANDAVVWNEGPYTVLLDTRSGRVKILGVVARGQYLQPPSVSGETVVWSLFSATSVGKSAVWHYDMGTRRRVELPGSAGVFSAAVVSGHRAAWVRAKQDRDRGQIVLTDVLSGDSTTLASGRRLHSPTLSGARLAWVQPRPSQPPVIKVLDVVTQRTWMIAPFASADEGLLGIALADNTLIWARTGAAPSDQLLAYDLRRGVSRVLVTAPGIGRPAADGDVIVWDQTSARGEHSIRSLRLSTGATQELAVVEGAVRQVAVGGHVAAWVVAGGRLSRAGVETARIPSAVTARRPTGWPADVTLGAAR